MNARNITSGLHKMQPVWVLGTILFLTACATTSEPFEYQPDNDGIQGPGILSGEDGLWTIFGPSSPAEKTDAPSQNDKKINE